MRIRAEGCGKGLDVHQFRNEEVEVFTLILDRFVVVAFRDKRVVYGFLLTKVSDEVFVFFGILDIVWQCGVSHLIL
jgi:hypothetical protein